MTVNIAWPFTGNNCFGLFNITQTQEQTLRKKVNLVLVKLEEYGFAMAGVRSKLKTQFFFTTIVLKRRLRLLTTFAFVPILLQMTLNEFKATLIQDAPPKGLSKELQALWYDGKGDWHQSHEIIQEVNTPSHSLIHAYLHRKEGDNWNANYWYNRAGRKMPKVSLAEEWENITQELLG